MRGRKPGQKTALDLSELQDPDPSWSAAEAWRCHFHVPIWWNGEGALTTTKSDWEAAIHAIRALSLTPHLEIETYTWHVIPTSERERMGDGGLTASIAAEFAALFTVMAPSGRF